MNCRICNKRIWPWQMKSSRFPGIHMDCKYTSTEYLMEQDRIGEMRAKEFFDREARGREMRITEIQEGCLRALRQHAQEKQAP